MIHTQSSSSSGSSHGSTSTSLSKHDFAAPKAADSASMSSNSSTEGNEGGLPYVQLCADYMRYLCWTNDPNDLHLNVYFDKTKPNLSDDYKVNGLQPVVKEKDSDRFVLRDAEKRWYLWDAWDGELLRVKNVWTQGFDSNEEIVENILDCISYVKRDAIAIWSGRKED